MMIMKVLENFRKKPSVYIPNNNKVDAIIDAASDCDKFQTITNEQGTIIVPNVAQKILIPSIG